MGIKAIVVAAILFSASVPIMSPAIGAGATDNTMTQLRKEFDDCVYSSIGAQIKRNKQVEPNLATEIAFQSCATEEQAIIGYAIGIGIPVYQVTPVIAGVKRQIKMTVRDLFANPAKYAFPNKR